MSDNKKKQAKGPENGIFIAARKMNHAGKIISDTSTTILADEYGGDGEVINKSKEDNQKGKWWEKTWVQTIFLIGALAGVAGLYFLIF
ncbi:MAG: hypothetical protein WD595_01960 [Waddliaceae bacterium]